MHTINESIIVGVDFSEVQDHGVLIVVRQNNGKIDILNAFQDEEAYALYQKLITKKENVNV